MWLPARSGYKVTPEQIVLDLRRDTHLWPQAWIEVSGTRARRAAGAPVSAIILPFRVNDSAGTPGLSFTLKSDSKGSITETITPDLQDPAYVLRWQMMEYEVGGQLLVPAISALEAGSIDCWFFYKEEEISPEEAAPCRRR